MKKTIVIIICMIPLLGMSQNTAMLSKLYYGNEKELGTLEILNDSMYRASFYFYSVGLHVYDTGYYRIHNDTVFLSSRVPSCLELLPDYYVKDDYIESPSLYTNVVFPINYVSYKFRREYKLSFLQKIINPFSTQTICKSRDKHYCMISNPSTHIGLDTIDNVLIIPQSVYREDILVIQFPDGIARRIMVPSDWRYTGKDITYIKIKDTCQNHLYFKEFPLLIRKNKLVPCDSEANRKCLIDNGFVFPKMDNRLDKKYSQGTNYRYCLAYKGWIGFIHFKYGSEPKL